MISKLWLKLAMFAGALALAGAVHAAVPSVPDVTYEALGLDRSATPKQLHEALVKRYKDPEQGFGKGTMGDYWEPIQLSTYMDPATFYEPPVSMRDKADRKECVECH
ncbi:MAG: hydroxylamine reductase, partial [Nitrosomonas sp.]|nr:hydroxylamine reductase [Nitrosomonas sp.]